MNRNIIILFFVLLSWSASSQQLGLGIFNPVIDGDQLTVELRLFNDMVIEERVASYGVRLFFSTSVLDTDLSGITFDVPASPPSPFGGGSAQSAVVGTGQIDLNDLNFFGPIFSVPAGDTIPFVTITFTLVGSGNTGLIFEDDPSITNYLTGTLGNGTFTPIINLDEDTDNLILPIELLSFNADRLGSNQTLSRMGNSSRNKQ